MSSLTAPAAPPESGSLTTPELRVDLDAVAHNLAVFRAASRGVVAVVKADAFGHGDIAAHLLRSGAAALGTTSLAHAVALRRRTGARTLAWLHAPSDAFDEAFAEGVDIAVPSLEHLRAVAAAAGAVGRPARVHLHVDLGMSRDGAPREAWRALTGLSGMLAARGLIEPVGLMGHLSHSAEPRHPRNATARMLFDNAVRSAARSGFVARVRHVAATAATLHGVGTDLELVRIGAGLYGIDPSHSAATPLRPTMTLRAPVVLTRDVHAGTGVGYGHTWVADRDTRLATVGVGYADGVPRVAAGRAEVLVRGRRAPVVGTVSMDQIVVDVGDAGVAPGETVTLLGGDGPSLREWADWAGSIEHEIITGWGERWTRVHRGGATQ